eukprot:2752152-Rhodomonas_salina.2
MEAGLLLAVLVEQHLRGLLEVCVLGSCGEQPAASSAASSSSGCSVVLLLLSPRRTDRTASGFVFPGQLSNKALHHLPLLV